MGRTMGIGVTMGHASWVVQLTKPEVYNPHPSWVVQWYIYPMDYGLYSGSGNMGIPWIMGRTTVYIPHGSCIVQQYAYPMGHGSYSG